MKNKCPVCNSCFNIVWIANRRFFNCWLCQSTYNLVGSSFKKVKSIVTSTDYSTTAVREIVTSIEYEE